MRAARGADSWNPGLLGRIGRPSVARAAWSLGGLPDRLRERLAAGVDSLIEHAAGADRLPNTFSVCLPGVHAGDLHEAIGDQVAASAGAACHGFNIQVSHVLAAMGVTPDVAMGTIRLSVGRFTTEEEIDRGAEIILGAL